MMENRVHTGSDRLDKVLDQLKKVKRTSRGYSACCPAHDDRSPSFSVALADDGKLLVKCQAGCSFQSIVEALGMEKSEFFPDSDNDQSGVHVNGHAKSILTLSELAEHKRLPVEFLDHMGLRDGLRWGLPAVHFAYRRRDGSCARTKIRFGLDRDDKGRRPFDWDGTKEEIIAYEPDLGARARELKQLVIVEGETDTLTLLYAGFGALGVPGANNTGKVEARHLEGIEQVFVAVDMENGEPDQGGKSFRLDVPKRLKALGFAGQVHELRMPDGAKDASALYQRDPDAFPVVFKKLLADASKPTSRSIVDLIETQVSDGIFFATGFPKLDQELDDGGLPTKSLTVIVGGPGSRKTGLGTHFADHLSRAGAAVMFMACDESRKSIITRVGQRAGFSRTGLRERSDIGEATRAGYRRYEMELGRVLHLVELGDDDDAQTLEEAHEQLVRIAGSRPRVLVIDSLQTVRCAASEAMPQSADTMRLRTDAKVAVLKRLKNTGTIIVVISEVSRAFYNGTAKRIEREHVLSAAKESGGVEFGVDLLVGLVRSSKEEDLCELVVAKCRIGREPRFWLQWNRDRARFEDTRGEPDEEAEVEAANTKSLELRQRILKTLIQKPGLNKGELREEIGVARATVFRVVAEMINEGQLLEGARHGLRVNPSHGGGHDPKSG